MTQLPVIDLVFFVVVAAFAIIACFKGFVDELFDRGAPLIAVWFAIFGYKVLAVKLLPYVHFPILANIFGFLLVFILVFLIIQVLQQVVGKLFEGKILGQLNRLLGFAFGIVEGLAIVAIVLIILTMQPWFDVKPLLTGSIFYRMFQMFLAVLPSQQGVAPVPSALMLSLSGRMHNV
ncbi:MAG: CvpA family protein [Treponema sp.]|nr:CvpA family protein [Treponema sp.]